MNNIPIDNINEFSHLITTFLFILLRSSIFVSLLPVIGSKKLPMQFRIGLAVFISLLMTPLVDFQVSEDYIPIMVLKEILIGLSLGFTMKVVFLGINMAGSFISHVMGISVATSFNPEMGQSTQISEAYGIIAMLFFLVMDAHHEIIFVFVNSFEILPIGHADLMTLIPQVLLTGSKFFVVAMKIGAPVIVCLMIVHILSGFLYKAAPQMNIFFVTLPLNIGLGFFLIIVSMPVLEYVLGVEFTNIKEDMMRIILSAKG